MILLKFQVNTDFRSSSLEYRVIEFLTKFLEKLMNYFVKEMMSLVLSLKTSKTN